MKAWKMAGCLLLLAVIICGCVAIGKGAEVSAAAPPEEESVTEETPTPEAGGGESGSAAVSKTYSEGLYFRSNGDGTCALAGLGSCSAASILVPPTSPAGDRVTEVLPYALAGSIVGAIELPATVDALSAASFADCPRLAYIRVASGNERFCEYDGVLYSADGTTLVCCPAGRGGTQLVLHPALRRIAAGAFAECKGLTTVVFSGSTAAWHALIVGDENEPLYAASLRFEG